MARATLLLIAMCSTVSTASRAHMGLDRAIEAVTEAIGRDPDNPKRYCQRAELHREHGNLKASLDDLETAVSLDPAAAAARVQRANLLVQLDRLGAAEEDLKALEDHHPEASETALVRARLLAARRELVPAARSFETALGRIAPPERPAPDLYLEAANAWVATGPGGLPRAAAVLDEGIDRLGAAALRIRALEIDVDRAAWDSALARLDGLIAAARRPERWLVRKAEVLEQADRAEEAHEALAAARAAIAALRPRLQAAGAMDDLRARIASTAARLGAAGATSKREDSP